MIVSVDNKPTNRFALIKGEIKRVKFTVTDENNDAVDCSSATCTFHAKKTMGDVADLTVADGTMDKTSAASGIIYVPIDTTNLTHSTDYFCELKVEYSATSIDHSGEIILTINQSIVE